MRRTIKTADIKPGIKAFAWEKFCLKKDNMRRQYNPNYDPLKLNEQVDKSDWDEFLREWENAG